MLIHLTPEQAISALNQLAANIGLAGTQFEMQSPETTYGYAEKDVRCTSCNKLLGRAGGTGHSEIEIQCPRCKTKNHISY